VSLSFRDEREKKKKKRRRKEVELVYIHGLLCWALHEVIWTSIHSMKIFKFK